MNFTLQTWAQNDYDNLIAYLHELVDEKYQAFNQRLIPNVDNLLGVRMPELQKLAKQIVKGNWQEYFSFTQNNYYEETMLKGLVIGKVKTDLSTLFSLISEFIPFIDNWAVCDSFCGGLKLAKEYPDEVLSFLIPYLHSQEEYAIRFAVVMLLNYYVNKSYIDTVLPIMDAIHHDGYYVKMAVAWCISICYVNFEEKTMRYLKHCNLNDFTYNKALQKIVESNQVSNEKKVEIRLLKRK